MPGRLDARCGSLAKQGATGRRPVTSHRKRVRPDAWAVLTEPRVEPLGSASGLSEELGQQGRQARRRATFRERVGGLEAPPDDRPTRNDGAVLVVGVRRVELGDPRPHGRDQESSIGLFDQIGAEVPGHGLEPRHRVGRRPGLDLVAGCSHSKQCVLEADSRWRCGHRGTRSHRRRRPTVRRGSRRSAGPARPQQPDASPRCGRTCRSRPASHRTSLTDARR